MLPGMYNPPGLELVDAEVSYAGANNSTSASTSFTFTGHTIGANDPTSAVVVSVMWGAQSRSAVSCTVNGAAATLIAQSPAGQTVNCALFLIEGISGTTANIVLTASGTQDRVISSVHRIKVADPAPRSILALGSGGVSGTVLSGSMDVLKGGVTIAVAVAAANSSFSWTGPTADAGGVLGSVQTTSRASELVAANDAARTVAATLGGASTNRAMVAAHWH